MWLKQVKFIDVAGSTVCILFHLVPFIKMLLFLWNVSTVKFVPKVHSNVYSLQFTSQSEVNIIIYFLFFIDLQAHNSSHCYVLVVMFCCATCFKSAIILTFCLKYIFARQRVKIYNFKSNTYIHILNTYTHILILISILIPISI